MVVENEKVVTCVYNAYVEGKDGQEDLMEQATEQRPLVYCHGERMMLCFLQRYFTKRRHVEHASYCYQQQAHESQYTACHSKRDFPKQPTCFQFSIR